MTSPRFQLIPGERLRRSVGGVGWRLLGTNNRELGRSVPVFPDADDALCAIDRVRAVAPHAVAHVVCTPGNGLWVWHLEDGGVEAASSGRAFRHERECRYNLEQFREAAPRARAPGP